jgi:CP family cyanate transporter-like MFS transporter
MGIVSPGEEAAVSSTTTPTVRAVPWLILAAVVLIGLNLRGPVVAVAPVIGLISKDLNLAAAQAGLLTSLPLLCFAFATPIASYLIARTGRDLAASITLVGVLIGTLIRCADGTLTAFVGTIVLGIFITVGNVVIPLIIADEVPSRHSGMATGAYTASLNVGSMVTTLGTAQVASAFGWRMALAAWIVLAVLALGVWILASGPRGALLPSPRIPVDADAHAAEPSAKTSTVIVLGLAFGLQAFAFYGMSAWLPKLLIDEQGFSAAQAGSGSAVFQVFGIAGALGLPLLVRWLGVRAGILTVLVFWLSVPLGLLIAPQLWLLWMITGGLAQGGGITVMFLLVVSLSKGAGRGGRVSATVQGIGYAIAAAAPAVLGALRDASGAWGLSLVAVAVSVVLAALFGLLVVSARSAAPLDRPRRS